MWTEREALNRVYGFKRAIEKGNAYMVSKSFTGLASGSSVQIYFSNPTGSGKKIRIVDIMIDATAKGAVKVYKNASVTVSGTALTPANIDLGSGNTSVAAVEYGGTYSVGDVIVDRIFAGGSGVRAIGSSIVMGDGVIIREGMGIVVEVTNTSASTADYSVEIIYYEE